MSMAFGLKFCKLVGFGLVLFSTQQALADVAKDQISTRKIGENSFEITLLSKSVFDVDGATRRIVPTAKSLCGDRNIDLGRYQFEMTQAVTGAGDEDWFKMVQQLGCVDLVPQKPVQTRTPQLVDERAIEAVRGKIRKLSLSYFERVYANLGVDASAALESSSSKSDSGSPKPQPTAPGTPTNINLFRISVYDNPANAPANGIYVAVDYDNSVGNVAHHCGYLMWHSFDGVKFTLGRIETGILNESLVASISADEIYATRKGLRCANFYDT